MVLKLSALQRCHLAILVQVNNAIQTTATKRPTFAVLHKECSKCPHFASTQAVGLLYSFVNLSRGRLSQIICSVYWS